MESFNYTAVLKIDYGHLLQYHLETSSFILGDNYFKIVKYNEDPKNSMDFGRRNPKKRDTFEVLQLSMLDYHEHKLFIVSKDLMNAIRAVFTFESSGLKLKLS